MEFQIALVVNVVTCFICVALGALSFLAPKKPGPHTEIGEAYHVSFIGWMLTSAYIALVHWSDVGWLFFYSIVCYLLALIGYLAAKIRFQHWLKYHLLGQGSSYIGLLSVYIFMNNKTGIWWLCLLPIVFGIPVVWIIFTQVLPRKINQYLHVEREHS